MSVEVVTFGCRLNAYEFEVIRREAGHLGNTIVINSCAVTSEAVRQARQTIRRLKRERPDAAIIVTGCAAQTDAAGFAAMPDVGRVLGNTEKLTAAAWRGTERVAVSDIMAETRVNAPQVDGNRKPAARFRSDPERLRPSLHLLHHPLRPWQFALAGA